MDTQHTDGDIVAGLRGLVTSVVTNQRAFFWVIIVSAVLSAPMWAFAPRPVAQLPRRAEACDGSACPSTGLHGGRPTNHRSADLAAAPQALARDEGSVHPSYGEAELVSLLQGYLTPYRASVHPLTFAQNRGRESDGRAAAA